MFKRRRFKKNLIDEWLKGYTIKREGIRIKCMGK